MNIIKNITLDLGDKEVSLTLDQAKSLKSALDDIFGKETVIYRDNSWWWNRPLITGPTYLTDKDSTYRPDTDDYYTVTCSNNTLSVAI